MDCILGYGKTGKSIERFLGKNELYIVDDNIKGFYSTDEAMSKIDDFNRIFVSPGMKNNKLVKLAKIKNIKICSDIELAINNIYENQKIIFVTGTNGKSSCVKLIEFMLNNNGIKAIAVGNIGVPILKELNKDVDVYIVEISSFQIDLLPDNINVDLSILLNIDEDHLNEYESFEEYYDSKFRITKFSENIFISFSSNKEILKNKYGSFENFYTVSKDVFYAAEYVAGYFFINKENFLRSIKMFKPLPHRLELVGNYNNKKIFNDSKSTNISSVVYAINRMEGSTLLILGGHDKGENFSKLNKIINDSNVKEILLFGEASKRIYQQLDKEIKIKIIDDFYDMFKFIDESKCLNVLFSPGCSSYDMFKNYEERGKIFVKFLKLFYRDKK